MALRRSRGRGWIELANRGSVESVARPNHHCLLHRHPRHSRLRSPQIMKRLGKTKSSAAHLQLPSGGPASSAVMQTGSATRRAWLCLVSFLALLQ
uniref:Uncharacterized protein n=1 Tax=Fagus sylvatica TaxID=28930 RepID=A0A2N9FET4_FAGSY